MYELADKNRKFPDFMVGWDYWRMPTDDMSKNRYAGMVNITIPFSPWTIGRHNYEIEETLAENRAAKANRDTMKNMTLRELGESQAKVEVRDALWPHREGLHLSELQAPAVYQTGR
jgi:hypothetical protein